jgi:hypothetical protein
MEGRLGMAATTSLPPQCPGHPSLVYEQHPDLGDYVYSPSINMWSNWRVTPEGHVFRLAGRSRCPTEEQVRMWRAIEIRLQDLIAVGIAAIQPPRGVALTRPFTREGISLREVRMDDALIHVPMEPLGVVEFFYDTPLSGELHMWPMATFQNMDLRGCRWVV